MQEKKEFCEILPGTFFIIANDYAKDIFLKTILINFSAGDIDIEYSAVRMTDGKMVNVLDDEPIIEIPNNTNECPYDKTFIEEINIDEMIPSEYEADDFPF